MSFNMTIVEMVGIASEQAQQRILVVCLFVLVSLSEAMAVICYALRVKNRIDEVQYGNSEKHNRFARPGLG